MNENRYDHEYEQQGNWYESEGMNWRKWLFIVGAVAVAVIVLSVFAMVGRMVTGYNELVDAQENVAYAEAQVETMMQRRIELIPDLVKVVESYADHEKEIFTSIANARAALSEKLGTGDIQAISEADNELTARVNELLVIAENYPELTAGEQYTRLMDEVSGSVTRIAMEREGYNAEVTNYNKLVKRFPGSILAKMFGFEELPQFQANRNAHSTSVVDMD